MSASTRSVQQQTLGTGQLWVALGVVTLAVVIALAIAFGSRIGTAPVSPASNEATVGVPPDAAPYHGTISGPSTIVVPSRGYTEYPAPAAGIDKIDHGARDDLGAFGPGRSGYVGDPGLAPRTNDVTVKSAPNKGPLHRRAQ